MWSVLRRWLGSNPGKAAAASQAAVPEREPATVAGVTAAPPVVDGPVINDPRGDGVVPAAMLPGTGHGYFVEVVGESHYQDVFRALRAKSDEREQGVILAPEPDNPYDPNAVAVQTFQGEILGYLKREDAARYQPTLLHLTAEGKTAICAARFQWGTKTKPMSSVWLDVEVPTALARHFGVKYVRQKRT